MSRLSDTLDDLALLISRVGQSVKDRTFADLAANDEAYDALTYRLAMIGLEPIKMMMLEETARLQSKP